MANTLIKDMFGTKKDINRTYNNMLYAKETLNLKGYAIWDFVSQPNKYLFDGISNEDYKKIQRKAFDELSSKVNWFAQLVK